MRITTKVVFEDDIQGTVDVRICTGISPTQVYRVYCDTRGLAVSPPTQAEDSLQCFFGWSDWIFNNVRGDFVSGAIIAALAVYLKGEKK